MTLDRVVKVTSTLHETTSPVLKGSYEKQLHTPMVSKIPRLRLNECILIVEYYLLQSALRCGYQYSDAKVTKWSASPSDGPLVGLKPVDPKRTP